MSTRLLLVGGGGFARETLDVIEAIERALPGSFEVVGIADDHPSSAASELLHQRDLSVVGTIQEFLAGTLAPSYDQYVIAIGHPSLRASIAKASRSLPVRPLVHPSANIGSRSVLQPGTVVCAGATISTGVWIGAHGHVNPNATIGHDAHLESFVSVNPAAVVSGSVHVGTEVLLGAASVVLQGLSIGDHAVVGAAACVTRDVPTGTTVKGVPAR